MEHKGLIPNESYEIFIIGDNITNYLHFPHILDHTCGNMYCYDSYTFPTLHFTVWVEDGRIDTICCDQVCYWKNTNLIGMPYSDFLIMCGQKPTKESKEYVLLSKGDCHGSGPFFPSGLPPERLDPRSYRACSHPPGYTRYRRYSPFHSTVLRSRCAFPPDLGTDGHRIVSPLHETNADR